MLIENFDKTEFVIDHHIEAVKIEQKELGPIKQTRFYVYAKLTSGKSTFMDVFETHQEAVGFVHDLARACLGGVR